MPAIWMDVDATLAEVLVNTVQLIDDTDFKTREEAVVYNQAGLDLVWEFVTTAGAYSQTAVTPTTGGGDYDWTNQGNGMYTIGIPASGGASINNDTEGFGRFVGYATGILPWVGPWIGFRDAGLNDKLIDSAYSATRGLAGTALPGAAADAAGGLAISDAGGASLDALIANTVKIPAARTAGTADSGTTTTMVDAARTESSTDYWKGSLIRFISGGLSGQTRLITAFDPVTNTMTFYPALTLAVSTHGYEIIPAAFGSILADWLDGGRLDNLLDAAVADIYHADIWVTVDAANSKDEYTLSWYKSGVRITSGITNPKIQVVKRADGGNLIAETAMTQIGSTGSYKYDESTNRMTAGEAVVAIASAMIDGSTRSFARVLSRDSSA